MDEISDLRLFLSMAASGSLSETARRQNSSLPAMSRRLAQIERRLGVRLIDRGSRHFLLTDEGQFLLDRGQTLIADLDEIEAELGVKAKSPQGRLRVSAPIEIGRRRIAPLVGEFLASNPGISIDLQLSDAKPNVLGDELDVSLQTDLPTDGNVVVRRLLTTRRAICASPAYIARHGNPARPSELISHNCIRLFRWGALHDRWCFIEDGAPVEVHVRGNMTTDSADVVHQWALDGWGVGFKAYWDVADDLREGRLIELLSAYNADEIGLYAAYWSRLHLPLRIRMFLDHIAAGLEAQLGTRVGEPTERRSSSYLTSTTGSCTVSAEK